MTKLQLILESIWSVDNLPGLMKIEDEISGLGAFDYDVAKVAYEKRINKFEE
jgi:hypothetical protein